MLQGTILRVAGKIRPCSREGFVTDQKTKLLFLMLVLFLALHSDATHVWSTDKNEILMTFRLQNPFACLECNYISGSK